MAIVYVTIQEWWMHKQSNASNNKNKIPESMD